MGVGYDYINLNRFLPKGKSVGFISFTDDDLSVYVYGCLSSNKLDDLQSFLDLGLQLVKENFLKGQDKHIFDRMKESIFNAGDGLADKIREKKLPLDDVDFSIGIAAIKSNVLYVWIDGEVSISVSRGSDRLVLNKDLKSQFYGSGYLENDDLLVFTLNSFIADLSSVDDLNDFSTLRDKVNFPIFVVRHSFNKVKGGNSIVNEPQVDTVVADEVGTRSVSSDEVSFIPNAKTKLNNSLDHFKGLSKDVYKAVSAKVLKLRPFLVKYFTLSKRYLYRIAIGYLKFITRGLDYLFGILYGNTSLKFKGYKSSRFRNYLGYFVSVLLLVVFVNLLFTYGPLRTWVNTDGDVGDQNSSGNYSSSDWLERKKVLESKIDMLSAYSDISMVSEFERLKNELISEIDSLRNMAGVDVRYLDFVLSSIYSKENQLYRVYPIDKMSEIYTADHLGSVEIVDFSVSGDMVYALDRKNSRVLVSNRVDQRFDVFVTDTSFKSLSQISCNNKECYILDESMGFNILDLETKKLSKFSALSSAGVGVKELALFKAGEVEYVYTLRPSEGRVLRYARLGQGIAQGEVWNKDAGFSANVTDIFVDGSIYELSSDGSFRRFYMGQLDSSSVKGFETPVVQMSGNLQLVGTMPRDPSSEMKNRIYVSDPSNNRIVVFNRDLNQNKKMDYLGSFKYRGQSKSVSFDNIVEMVLSSDEKYLYALSNNVVFKFSVTDSF